MKTTRETILRNTFWYGLVTGAGLVAGLLMSVVLARGLGPARMGDYSYLLWLLRTLTAVATLGFALATTRYTAGALARDDRGSAGAYLGLFLRRQLVTTAMVGAIVLPLVWVFAPSDLMWPLIILTMGLLPTTLESIYSHAAYGAQRYDLTTQVSTLKMSLHLLAAIAAMALGGDILGLTIGLTLGTTISCVLQRRQVRRLYPTPAGSIATDARAELRAYLLPLSVVAVLDAVVWDRSEVLFLRLHATSAEIAFYSVAFGLATRAMVAAQVAAGTLLPALAALHGQGAREEFGRVYQTALRWVALVGAPLAAVGAALAPGLVSLLYGEPYLAVASLLGPLLAVALVGVLRQVAWAALRAVGDRHWALHATWISAVLNVAAAAMLIPRYGVWGAVVANATAQLTASAVAFVAVARQERCGFPALGLARIAAAAALAFFTTRAVAPDGMQPPGLLAAGTLGLAAFLAAASALGALGLADWWLLTAAVGRVPRRAGISGLVAAAIVLFGALYGPVMWELVEVWATVPYYSYGFLVPLFSAWALWDVRRRLARPAPAWSAVGLASLAAGLALLALATALQSLPLAALSLPAVLAGTAHLLLGPSRFGAVVFPLGFLAFMAPLPEGALPALSLPLQHLAAWFAGQTLEALGIPAVRAGLRIDLPRITLLITEACNGLRFLLAMIVVGTAFAWTTQSRSTRRVAVLGLAVVVAIAANLIRVTGTGLLAYYWGPEAALGFFHMAYGKVVYLVMFVPFVAGVLFLRRGRLGSARHVA